VIYCVIPEALAGELFDKMTDYYKDDPNVEVIIDRRKGDRRARKGSADSDAQSDQRVVRDRRRRRPGSFSGIDPG
jgi:hypothetical protein